MHIRPYVSTDYPLLKELYKESGWFDPETDAEERMRKQIDQDPQAILLAEQASQLRGSVTLLMTGRLGLFFRLTTTDHPTAAQTRTALLQAGETIFKARGYHEVHILTPEHDNNRQKEYQEAGFQKGKLYRWLWKKVSG